MSIKRRIGVFVSSAMSELENEREISLRVIKEMNLNPLLFEIWPAMNSSPSEAYLEEVRDCDIFLLILWKSLRPAVVQEYDEAVRNDKPIVVVVKTLSGSEEREEGLRAFLESLSVTAPSALVRKTVYKTFRGVSELERVLRESVSREVAQLFRDPVHTLSREEMYGLGSSIIHNAQRRLYVFQRTPSLILGARDYLALDEQKITYERELSDGLKEWIEKNRQLSDRESLYLFSAESTKMELKNFRLLDNTEYVKRVRDNIEYYKDIERKTGYRFRVGIMDSPISGPLIVGDSRYAIWLLGSDDAVSISQENANISRILVRMLRVHSQKNYSANEIMEQIEIEQK